VGPPRAPRGLSEERRRGPAPPTRPDYKGAPLEAERGPGLGCFWSQIALLVVLLVLTPYSALHRWPIEVSVFFLAATIVLLFFAGQTVIFLLRLVAADRRSRRRPLASRSRTVGELEDDATHEEKDA
jgi:hypothetical protein